MSITIAVPIYNGEKYIDRCLSSILCQKEVDFEISVALDVSADRSREILRSYEEKYTNIKVYSKSIHEKGLGKSRNLLINTASTEFIYFLDVDDFLSHDKVIANYLKMIENDSSDMLIGSHYHLEDQGSGLYLESKKYLLTDAIRKDLFIKYFYSLIYSWNKVYKVTWLRTNQIHNKYEVAEDLYFFAKCFIKTGSLSLSSDLGLVYDTSNADSITNSVMYKITEQKIENYLNMSRELALELDLNNEFDGLYLFSFTLWLQTLVLRDGYRTGSLSLLKAISFMKQIMRIERRLSMRRRIVWEFQLGFKKYLFLRHLLP